MGGIARTGIIRDNSAVPGLYRCLTVIIQGCSHFGTGRSGHSLF